MDKQVCSAASMWVCVGRAVAPPSPDAHNLVGPRYFNCDLPWPEASRRNHAATHRNPGETIEQRHAEPRMTSNEEASKPPKGKRPAPGRNQGKPGSTPAAAVHPENMTDRPSPVGNTKKRLLAPVPSRAVLGTVRPLRSEDTCNDVLGSAVPIGAPTTPSRWARQSLAILAPQQGASRARAMRPIQL